MKHVFRHIMVDLETLSTDPKALVLSIGLVSFLDSYVYTKDDSQALVSTSWETENDNENFYYGVLSQVGQEERHISESTLSWWEEQESSAREVLTESKSKQTSVVDDLEKVYAFLKDQHQSLDGDKNYLVLWANGASFDHPIIKSLFIDNGFSELSRIWSYKHDACYRTMLNAYKIPDAEYPPMGTHHNALDDARFQATRLLNEVPTHCLVNYCYGSLLP